MASRSTTVSAAGLELLHSELVAHMLRNHDDGRHAREELYRKLESCGYETGRRFAERLLARDASSSSASASGAAAAAAAAPRPAPPLEPLEAVKFLCKEFWTEAFRKPVDKLQTNNRGTFVLQDFGFRWGRFLSAAAGEDASPAVLRGLLFPCGMVRGAMGALGYDCTVNADVTGLPRVVFHVRIAAS